MNISPTILVALRKDRGWSQEKLAAISDLSVRTIQRAEKDGSCSLDTKLAFASVFEIAPTELSQTSEPNVSNDKITYKVNWSGAFGLFILGMLAPIIVLLTAPDGQWELASASIVWGLTIILTVMNFGASETYRFFDNTSWIVKYPSYVQGLNKYIVIAYSVTSCAYIVGGVSTLVVSLTIAVHAPEKLNDLSSFIAVAIRPFVHAVLFVELWIRPYKRKMEKMLAIQLG